MKKLLSVILSAIMIVSVICSSQIISVSAAGAGMAGDVNTDKKVNNKDVTVLFRHVSGVTQDAFDETAADCDGDGTVDNKDVVDLFRYLSGFDVTLYYGKKPTSPKEPGYVIPDEDLHGMNTSARPLSDDGNGAAILTRLKQDKTIRNNTASADDMLTRIKFAEDITYLSGFGLNISDYICQNDFSDIKDHTSRMKYSEIAVHQGFMLIPADTKFDPNGEITYGEVLRGLLYALGYREYADEYGVAKLAAEVGVSNYIDLSKKNSETLTYAEYAQVVSNALQLKLVLCVEKDGAVSEVQYDLAKSTYDSAVAVERSAEMNLEKAQKGSRDEEIEMTKAKIAGLMLDRDLAKNKLEDTKLLAPFTGVVSEKFFENHETVLPGVAILTLVDDCSFEGELSVSEELVARQGDVQSIECTFETLPDKVFPASVRQTSSSVQKGNRSYLATISIDAKPEDGLLIGMVGTAKMTLMESHDFYLIPSSALVPLSDGSDDGDSSVWIFDSATNSISRRNVKVGVFINDQAQILSGLKGGETIVSAGARFLTDGQEVRPVSE